MIYVSIPYSHPDPRVIEQRMDVAWRYFGHLSEQGIHAMSPVYIGHVPMQRGYTTTSHDFWLPYSEAMLRLASEVHVLNLDGWKQSIGVQYEIRRCREMFMRGYLIDPNTFQPMDIV